MPPGVFGWNMLLTHLQIVTELSFLLREIGLLSHRVFVAFSGVTEIRRPAQRGATRRDIP